MGRNRQTNRQAGRQTDRQIQTQTDRQRQREREKKKKKEGIERTMDREAHILANDKSSNYELKPG